LKTTGRIHLKIKYLSNYFVEIAISKHFFDSLQLIMTVHENETKNILNNSVQIGSNVKNNLALKGFKYLHFGTYYLSIF